MTYSSSPYVSTYATEKVNLINDLTLFPANESASWGTGTAVEDNLLSGMVNVLPFKDQEGNVYGETRYGITGAVVTTGNNTKCKGYHFWERAWSGNFDVSYELLVTNDGTASRLWGSSGSGWTQVALLATHTGDGICRFAEYIDASNNKSLVMSDGHGLYIITIVGGAITSTQVTDLDMPNPHVPFPVAIDGYIFLAKEGTGDIYNCDLNNPSSWTPGNFISAEMYPDDIVALVKVNNYLLAVGQYSSEFFYDAGNATGSPLARYAGAVLPFGTPCPNSIASNKDTVMMLATGEGVEPCFKIIQGFKHSDFPGKAALALYNQHVTTIGYVDTVRAGFLRQNGAMFYFFVPDGSVTDAPWYQPTLIASLDTKIWVLTRSDITSAVAPKGAYAFPVLFASTPPSSQGSSCVAGQFGLTGGGAWVGRMDGTKTQDTIDGTNHYEIYQQFTTPPEKFGTWNQKFMYRLAVDYRVVPANDVGPGALGVTVQWSDDMGTTWSGGYLLASATGGFPFVFRLGQFRQRMFKIAALSKRMQWFPLEVNINKGIT